jgi:hypothetical protein
METTQTAQAEQTTETMQGPAPNRDQRMNRIFELYWTAPSHEDLKTEHNPRGHDMETRLEMAELRLAHLLETVDMKMVSIVDGLKGVISIAGEHKAEFEALQDRMAEFETLQDRVVELEARLRARGDRIK